MTRAKTELVMTWRREVPIFTSDGIKTVKKNRSRFLDALIENKNTEPKNKAQQSFVNMSPSYTSSVTRVQKSKPMESKTSPSYHSSAYDKRMLTERPTNKFEGTSQVYLNAKSLSNKFDGTSQVYSNGESMSNKSPPYMNVPRSPSIGARSSGIVKKTGNAANIYSTNRSTSQGISARFDSTARSKVVEQEKAKNSIKDSTTLSPMKKKINADQAPAQVDSTWFFPVGSNVLHKHYGKGVVLNPKSYEDNKEMLVYIQFPSGDRREFPVNGNDISPIVL